MRAAGTDDHKQHVNTSTLAMWSADPRIKQRMEVIHPHLRRHASRMMPAHDIDIPARVHNIIPHPLFAQDLIHVIRIGE